MNLPAVCSPGIYKERFPLPPGFTNKHNCCYSMCDEHISTKLACRLHITPVPTECKIEGIDISVQSRVQIMPPPSQDIRSNDCILGKFVCIYCSFKSKLFYALKKWSNFFFRWFWKKKIITNSYFIFFYVYMSKCRQFEGLSTGIFTWTIPNHTIKLQLHWRGTSSFE